MDKPKTPQNTKELSQTKNHRHALHKQEPYPPRASGVRTKEEVERTTKALYEVLCVDGWDFKVLMAVLIKT